MKTVSGNIENPFNINTNIIPTHQSTTTTMGTLLSSYHNASGGCGCFIETPTRFIAADNLSNVLQIFNMFTPGSFGNTVFQNFYVYDR